MSHRVTLNWIGGEHAFALPIGGLRAVQAACDAGPVEVLNGLRFGTYRVDWPLAVLKHGLIGAGMEDAEARKLIDRLADIHPIVKFQIPALRVITAAVIGVEDDPVGEEAGELNPPQSGSSAGSTPAAPRQDTDPAMSTE